MQLLPAPRVSIRQPCRAETQISDLIKAADPAKNKNIRIFQDRSSCGVSTLPEDSTGTLETLERSGERITIRASL